MIFLRESLLSKQTTIVEICSVLINITIALPLLIFLDFGILAKLWGNFGTAMCLFLFYVIYFIRKGLLRFEFNFSMLKESLSFSIPLFPIFAGAWIAGLSDRLVIANYVSLASVGLYSVGFTIGKLLYIVQDTITQVIGPISMSGLIADKDNTKLKIANSALLVWLLMIYINFGMYLFAKELIWVFADDAYKEAFIIIPIIGLSYVFGSQQRIFSTVISFHKKNWVVSSGGIIQAVSNLGMNLLLVPKFGYIAAAYSTIITLFLYSIWLYYWAQRYEKINYDLITYFKSFILLLFLTVILAYFPPDNFLTRLIIFLLSGLTMFYFINPLKIKL